MSLIERILGTSKLSNDDDCAPRSLPLLGTEFARPFDYPEKMTTECAELLKRLSKEIYMRRGRRVELSVSDTALFRKEMIRANAEWHWRQTNWDMPIRASFDGEPYPNPEDATEIKLRGVPCFLDRPETKVVVWDDREQWLTLAATCYTPELSP